MCDFDVQSCGVCIGEEIYWLGRFAVYVCSRRWGRRGG